MTKPLKIAVYTICKNEAPHIARWYNSCQDADVITVADTGSTDRTRDVFRAIFKGDPSRSVHSISINPWRFDDAHNAALALVPGDVDICIPLHLDEVLMPGWRQALEEKWIEGTTKCFYTYVFDHKPDGSPNFFFQQNRIHARHGYRWKYPDHEGVYPYHIPERWVSIPELRIEQWQDRSKDRSQTLTRLLMGYSETPDSRMTYYLGRELYYYGQFEKALFYLRKYFDLPGGFAHEQMEAARFMSACYEQLSRMPGHPNENVKKVAAIPVAPAAPVITPVKTTPKKKTTTKRKSKAA